MAGMALDVRLVRTALEEALDAWWQRGRLPPPALLRDGLLVLEAGHPLEEAQVSLLLRTALNQRKGMLTALKHQTDPERTAVILADALLAPPPAMLTLAELDRLRREDDRSAAWLAALPGVLVEETSSADASRRQRATELLYELRTAWPLAAANGASYTQDDRYQLQPGDSGASGPAVWPPGAATAGAGPASPLRRSWFMAVAVLIPIVVLVLVLLWWQQQTRLDGMVFVPAGDYPVSPEASGGAAQVELAAFAIDRLEVTAGDYRRCTAAGRCAAPASSASATRPSYLLDPAFNRYPVINVDWRSAGDYCAWLGKRLPTAVEWEVAAGYAPSTQRQYVYPWGDQFQVQRANSRLSGIGDTQMVGSFQPIGDSPWSASDMAGNVAEWTATNVGKDPASDPGAAAPDRFLVKGGSFADGPEGLAVAAGQLVAANTSAPWLGFRCAVHVSEELAAARVPGRNASPD